MGMMFPSSFMPASSLRSRSSIVELEHSPPSSTPIRITPDRPCPGRSFARAQMLRRSLLRSAAERFRSTRSDSRSNRNRSSSLSSSGLMFGPPKMAARPTNLVPVHEPRYFLRSDAVDRRKQSLPRPGPDPGRSSEPDPRPASRPLRRSGLPGQSATATRSPTPSRSPPSRSRPAPGRGGRCSGSSPRSGLRPRPESPSARRWWASAVRTVPRRTGTPAR